MAARAGAYGSLVSAVAGQADGQVQRQDVEEVRGFFLGVGGWVGLPSRWRSLKPESMAEKNEKDADKFEGLPLPELP